MSQLEFVKWGAYFEKHPFDDFHLHTLPAALQVCATNGADMTKVLDILLSRDPKKTIPKPKANETPFDVDMSVFAAFGLTIPPTYKGIKP